MTSERRHAFSTDLADLRRIGDPGCDYAVWIRRAPRAVKQFTRNCPVALLPNATFKSRFAGVYNAVLAAIPAGAGDGRAFAYDVAKLAAIYRYMTGAENLRIRIERVPNDGCRLFHVDRVKVRLVCIYRGAGTEWLPESNVDRDGLKKGKNDAIIRNPYGVRHLRPWAVALQKGELASGVPDSGLVHRSPPVRGIGDTRLVVVIDDADVAYR